MTGLTNWAGNHRYVARARHAPRTLEELQELVRATPRLKVLGSRHSFNDIADTTGDQVVLDRLVPTVELDPDGRTVAVAGAIRYGDLAPRLHEAGFALHNLASLPHISIAGACATATHGSGDTSGNLSTAVRSIQLVTGTGELCTIARETDPHAFPGAVVALGALGIVTRLTLALEPTYRVRQNVYEQLPFAAAIDHFDDITGGADSVSLFTTWTRATIDQVWLKRRVGPDAEPVAAPPTFFGANRATGPLHPVPSMSPESCTQQLGAAGPWHERLPHFRLDHTPSAGDELQTEYFVPRHQAPAALTALDAIRARIAPLVQTSEIRTIAADDLWLSPAFGRASVGIHFTWRPDWAGVSALLPVIDGVLAPFEPRPHWAKVFTLGRDWIAAAYPRLGAFRALRDRFDPERRFANDYLARTVD